jgi:hypothetical protein
VLLKDSDAEADAVAVDNKTLEPKTNTKCTIV